MERHKGAEMNQTEQIAELVLDLAIINPDFILEIFEGFGKTLSSQVIFEA